MISRTKYIKYINKGINLVSRTAFSQSRCSINNRKHEIAYTSCIVLFLLTAALLTCRIAVTMSESIPAKERFTIAFGSCAHQTIPQPIWGPIRRSNPDIFIFLGDNVYADTTDMSIKRDAYNVLDSIKGYRELRRKVPILAIWDDHDYGYNDAGKEYTMKEKSEKLFLDFFGEPAGTPRRRRKGIFTSYYFGASPGRLQVILLDTRFFRDRLDRTKPKPPFSRAYSPTKDRSRTILGMEQWKWLDGELRKPADLRIIATGIQLVADDHPGEKWGNFPHEKERLYNLINSTGAERVIVLSGDRHYAEISVEREGVPYPIYDITSSSLNRGWLPGSLEPNRHRIGNTTALPNYGLLKIDWKAGKIRCEIRGDDGNLLIEHRIMLKELRFRKR